MAKEKSVKIKSPVGVLGFSHLDKADTEGKYADGKFKLQLICDADDPAVEAFRAACEKFATDKFGRKPKKLNLPISDGDEIAEDKDKPELRGKVIIKAKSQFAVGLAEKGEDGLNEIAPEDAPRAGDRVKFSAALGTYDSPAIGKGVTLYLNSVLVLERNARRGSALNDFDDEDFDDDDSAGTTDDGGNDDADF